jgi:MarR-like DNA-binding transcriptional regulator SgrR of sgrS sRNA
LPISDFTEAEATAPEPPAQRQTVLLVGSSAKLVESTAEVLRMWGFSVSTALSHRELRDRLESAIHPPNGLLVLVEHYDAGLSAVLAALRESSPRLKVVLQIVACNQDELDNELLASADLVISTDTSSEAIQRQLRSLFS